MNSAMQKRLAAVGALLVGGGLLTYLSFGGIEENLVYFWDAKELVARGESAYGQNVRLGGVVQNDSFKWDSQSLDLNFLLSESPEAGGATVAVAAKGAPPQMFREGIGVVVEGKYDGKTFTAERVIVKHSNEYKPPEPGQEPQKLYRTLMDES